MFAAQALSLLGSGLATVALGLLAYELAGANAGMVLGIAMAIKMLAYVFLSPVVAALAVTLPRRRFLVFLDLARAGLVLWFPFVDQVWQVYLLIFLLFSFTAGFTPVFQATIPEIVKDQDRYVDALTLSRVAFNIESIASPILAGMLMTVIAFNWFFVFTSLGFLVSAFLVSRIRMLDVIGLATAAPFLKRVSSGMLIFSRTPRLRGLMILNGVVALMGANVYINTVVAAHGVMGGNERTYLNLLLVFGVASVAVAVALRPLIRVFTLRRACQGAAFFASLSPLFLLTGPVSVTLFGVWLMLGLSVSLITTSAGLLLRSSASPEDSPSVFAAQFSLSHACWFGSYLLVAWLGREFGVATSLWITGVLAFALSVISLPVWSKTGNRPLAHEHGSHSHEHLHVHDDHHHHEHVGDEGPEPHSHPHYHGQLSHAHEFMIDDHHRNWPRG